MEILGIGPLELLFILLIALIAVGPRDLGKAARSTGRLLNQLYKSEAWANLSEASRNLRSMPNRLAREAALEELEQVKQEMEQGVNEGIDQFRKPEQKFTKTSDPAASTEVESLDKQDDSVQSSTAEVQDETRSEAEAGKKTPSEGN